MALTNPPTWATDTNYPAGSEDWSGQPSKVEPSSGRKALGFVPLEVIPADWVNFLMNAFSTKIRTLQRPLDAFATILGLTVTDGNVENLLVDNVLVRPAGPSDHRSIVIFDGTTARKTRTCDATIDATGELTYVLYKTRTKFLQVEMAAGSGWTHGGPNPTPLATVNNAYAVLPLSGRIPSGCTITRVRAGVNAGTNNVGANRIQMVLIQTIPNTVTGGNTVAGNLGAPVDDGGGTGDKILTLTPTPYDVVDGETISVGIKASASAASANDRLNWVEVQFIDPGPRNA